MGDGGGSLRLRNPGLGWVRGTWGFRGSASICLAMPGAQTQRASGGPSSGARSPPTGPAPQCAERGGGPRGLPGLLPGPSQSVAASVRGRGRGGAVRPPRADEFRNRVAAVSALGQPHLCRPALGSPPRRGASPGTPHRRAPSGGPPNKL